jgi:two-component system response regulator FixJ
MAETASSELTIYIVDDEEPVRKALYMLAKSDGLKSEVFESAQTFLNKLDELGPGCLLLDVCMPDINGLEVQEALRKRGIALPVIVITGHGDVATAVRAMKGGASDFIEKPFDADELLQRVHECLDRESERRNQLELKEEAVRLLERLTRREREVMDKLVEGLRNKEVAASLHISFRTVELHRASIMEKLGAHSLSDIVRIAMTAAAD